MEQFARITHDINIMGGKACIKGTRCTVGMIVSQLGEGKTPETLVEDFPYLSREDVQKILTARSCPNMVDSVITTKTLPEFLFSIISTEKVQVQELDGEIRLKPITETKDYISLLRGSLANNPERSVDNFLARKRDDREMEA